MRKLWLVSCLVAAGCSGGGGQFASRGIPASAGQAVTAATPESSQPRFKHPADNLWQTPAQAPLSTFAVDVDTGSYGVMRGYLNQGRLPPTQAIRVEELINYFPYDYAAPSGKEPFRVNVELADCPWNKESYLLRVGLQAHKQPDDQLPARNLVFLVDVSGSMGGPDRLDLLRAGLAKLVQGMTAKDHVAIVTYAGHAGVLLEPTSDKEKILAALGTLESGGSTNGEAGIRGAYELARRNFDKTGVNRVLLCTDGDFNVGVSDNEALVAMIEKERESGVFLSTLGVGLDNVNDAGLEQLADKGNGNYSFLDSADEAEKVLVREAGSTLVTVAKDVKIQVEFNPAAVQKYRLLGYENRLLAAEDFNDDAKDAGEVGSGHRVTALYQIFPTTKTQRPLVDPLRYQKGKAGNSELAMVKLRYQPPQGGVSKLLSTAVTRDQHLSLDQSSDDFRFAVAVAEFGMALRGSKEGGSLAEAEQLAQGARGQDTEGYRSQFVELVGKARSLAAPAS